MKKIIMVLMITLVVMLSGCASKDSFDPDPGGYDGLSTSDFDYVTTEGGITSGTKSDGTEYESKMSEDGTMTVTEVYTDGSSSVVTFGSDGSYKVVTTAKDGTVSTTIYDAPDPGQLTASEWSDLENYEFFLSLFEYTSDQEEGVFDSYYSPGYFDAMNLVTVTVDNGTQQLQGAVVELIDDSNNVVFKAVTNVHGVAYLLPNSNSLDTKTIKVTYNDVVSLKEFDYSVDDKNVAMTITTSVIDSELIEIMFVIDTTGSMGDELEYLQSEIQDVIDKLYEEIPNADIKLALLFYRDTEDDYVTKYFDFASDIEGQIVKLNNQSFGGGGDYPEAVDIAIDEAVNKQWTSSTSTKLIFHVLDAPPHSNQGAMTKYSDAVKTAAEKGIRIIPIASSGVDKETEYLLRNSAIYTGGTYIFITNDSGIGGDHIEATTGETTVEFLNSCMIRIIKEYHTGEVIEPVYYRDDQ